MPYRYNQDSYSSVEKLQTVLIVGLITLCSLIISGFISSRLSKDLDVLKKAVQITENGEFQYAVETQNVSGIFGTGIVQMKPVTDNRLIGEYGTIIDITERYTYHTRQVCSSTNKDGTCKSYRTEIYYTWDFYGKTINIQPSLYFMSVEFYTNEVSVGGSNNLPLTIETVKPEYIKNVYGSYFYDSTAFFSTVGDTRHYFQIIPVSFSGTLYIRSTRKGYVNQYGNPCGCLIVQKSPDDIIKSQQRSVWFYRVLFPILLPLVALIVSVLYFYNNGD